VASSACHNEPTVRKPGYMFARWLGFQSQAPGTERHYRRPPNGRKGRAAVVSAQTRHRLAYSGLKQP
jgi:hypothetical protein